jgi:predicted aldo/keto reductase-like oxidoreductase
MSRISRRRFLARATAAAGAAAFAGRFGYAAEDAAEVAPPDIKTGTDMITLGKSKIQTSVLGLGTGTRGGREQLELGQKAFTKLVRHGLDLGIRYVDTADRYGMKQMHGMVRKALEGVPREQYFVQTKTPAKDAATAKKDIERFRSELGIECLDTLLMHCMTRGSWPADMRPVMDVLNEAKEKERVKAVGVSCHGLDPLVTSADNDWIEVHLVRINPFGQKMDGEPDQVAAQMKTMYQLGHGVLGMKVYGETGFASAEERLKSLQYVLGLGCVHAFTIGFTSTEQIDETLDLIEKAVAINRDQRREAA